MVSVQQHTIEWSGAVSGTSVFHFLSASGDTGDRRDALGNFATAVAGVLVPDVHWRIGTEGSSYETTDGSLTATWSTGTAIEGDGTSTGLEAVAQSTQVLARWDTDVIRDRRALRGRTYIPGLDKSLLTNHGELQLTAQSDVNDAITALIAHGQAELTIWGRPRVVGGVNQGDGVFGVVTGGSTWNELAVQRGRRRA